MTEACAIDRDDADMVLLAAYRAGDDGAFVKLMTRYEARLRGMCWSYVHDADIVDDLIQETFCHVLEHLDRIDQSFNVAAWIHRIAANLCLDELRSRARRTQTHVAVRNPDPMVSEVLDRDRRCRPEEALELALTRSQVSAAIRRLPARQRDVLELRDLRGMSEAATARSLGITPGAVQGILHRARERFKESYIALESDASLPGECGQVVFVIEHLRLRWLRRERLKAVERHLLQCGSCGERLGAPGQSHEARLDHAVAAR